jgi:hypothetical protein
MFLKKQLYNILTKILKLQSEIIKIMKLNFHILKSQILVVIILMLEVNSHHLLMILLIIIKFIQIIKLLKIWIIKLIKKFNYLLTIIYSYMISKISFKTPQLKYVISNKLTKKWTNNKSFSNNPPSPPSKNKKLIL